VYPRFTPILALLGVLYLFSSVGAEDDSATMPAEDLSIAASLPIDLEVEVAKAIEELDDDDWQKREAATIWLVIEADRWARRIPISWEPKSAEARWRWNRIRRLVDDLGALPRTLRHHRDPRQRGHLAQLREETGVAFIAALERCLDYPDTRVRARAVTLLGETSQGVDRLRNSAVSRDASGRVRENLYEVARRSDSDWAFLLIRDALLLDRSESITAVVARAAKSLGDPRILPSLRERCQEGEAVHPEVLLALVAYGRPEDSGAVSRLLSSGEYRHASAALDALGSEQIRFHAEAIARLLSSKHWDLRVRALRRLEDEDRRSLPYYLLDLLEVESLDVYTFGVEQLARMGGEDFLGDIEYSLRRWPPHERPFYISTEEGRAVPRPVPAKFDEAFPVPALIDRDH